MTPSDVIELRKKQSLSDFLDNMSEDQLLAELDGPPNPPLSETFNHPGAPIDVVSNEKLETNTRLTVVRWLETAPQMGKPFSFRVRKFCGAAYIQAMRTTLARARKYARDNNYELDEPFRMIQLGIDTQATCDVVTITRVPKGQKHPVKLEALAKMLGGSQVQEDDDD